MHNYNFDGAGYVHCKYVEVDRNKMIKDINLIYAKMKYTRTLLIIVFASVVQLFYGQERYTISGEFPDRSLDGEYVFLYEHSALVEEPERMKQAFKDTILVVGNTFHYEGTLNRKPFLVSLSCSKGRQFRYNTSFVIEPGDIQLRIVDWGSEGNVSGAPINNDYNAYIIECKKQVDKMLYLMRTKREEEVMKSDARLNASFRDAYIRSTEGCLLFIENQSHGIAKNMTYGEVKAALNLAPEENECMRMNLVNGKFTLGKSKVPDRSKETVQFDTARYMRVIAEENMENYCNADTVYVYEVPLLKPYKGVYTKCIGINMVKEGHPYGMAKILLMEGDNAKDKYMKQFLESIRYSDSILGENSEKACKDKFNVNQADKISTQKGV